MFENIHEKALEMILERPPETPERTNFKLIGVVVISVAAICGLGAVYLRRRFLKKTTTVVDPQESQRSL
jgi:hypothetical protein